MKIVVAVAVFFALVILLGRLGLRVQPKPFAPFAQQTGVLDTMPLPEGLPAPVERYYRQLYGDRIPLIQSAVISGRAVMSPVGGIKIPARFRFVHRTGQDYRHDFEMTWFGRTVGAGNETYVDGKSRLNLPMGLSDEGPQVDQAANLSLWAEYAWLPAVWLTDPRARWAPVDDETALLIVPFGDGKQTFVARFDPDSGRLRLLESMPTKTRRAPRKRFGSTSRRTGPPSAATRYPPLARSPGSTRVSRGRSSQSRTSCSTQMSTCLRSRSNSHDRYTPHLRMKGKLIS